MRGVKLNRATTKVSRFIITNLHETNVAIKQRAAKPISRFSGSTFQKNLIIRVGWISPHPQVPTLGNLPNSSRFANVVIEESSMK